MQACADYLRSQNPWASEHRTPEVLRILDDYGAAAQRILPHLEETASLFEQGEPDFPKRLSEQKARAVRQQIENIEAAEESPELRSLR
jgi:predicted house-cleaning NTP pyrophosphatase (Maf/HAM1 superfamily)